MAVGEDVEAGARESGGEEVEQRCAVFSFEFSEGSAALAEPVGVDVETHRC